MAAALRQAARSMLQRSPPAAAAQRLRRLVHGGGSPSTFSAAAAQRPASLMDLHRRKQELSEELYDVVAEMEKRILGKHYKPRGVIFRTNNSDLLGTIAEHVDPRPNDSDWRWFRGKHRFDHGVAWIVSVGFLYCTCFHGYHEIEDWLAPKETSLPSEEVKGQ